jgi:hypothetical protein
MHLILLLLLEKIMQMLNHFKTMELIYIICALLSISFLWAVWSLRGLNVKRMKEVTHAKKTLQKGKIIFDRSHSS